MEQYALYYGAWSSYHQSYTWQSLAVACADLAVPVVGEAHRASADALSALGVLKALAALQREVVLEVGDDHPSCSALGLDPRCHSPVFPACRTGMLCCRSPVSWAGFSLGRMGRFYVCYWPPRSR